MKPHKHDYYEYTNKHRRAREGEGGIVVCRNNGDCCHFLEPRAMQIFRNLVAAGKTTVIREYPKTYDRRTNRELISIYAKPVRKAKR